MQLFSYSLSTSILSVFTLVTLYILIYIYYFIIYINYKYSSNLKNLNVESE